MKAIDNDIKKLQDEMTEAKNNLAQLTKKDGTNFLTQDISEAIYSNTSLNPNQSFIEKMSSQGSEMFVTLIAIVNKTKIPAFLATYEKIIPWNDQGTFGAIPRSAKFLDIEDKDGNQLWRIIIMREKLEEYIVEGRKQGLTLRKFTYNYEQYQKELQQRTELENKVELMKTTLAKKSLYAFSELYIALIHLKVMRAFIDGVLRFGIPARFYIGIVQPNKGQEKQLLQSLNDKFDDKTLAGMYGGGGGGGKDDGDGDDFFSFVSIPLTTPASLM